MGTSSTDEKTASDAFWGAVKAQQQGTNYDVPAPHAAPDLTTDLVQKAKKQAALSMQIGQTRQSTFLTDLNGKKLPPPALDLPPVDPAPKPQTSLQQLGAGLMSLNSGSPKTLLGR